MKNKPPQKAEFVKNFIDRDGEVGELYKVGSEFFVVGWYRDDVERKPCKHNTIFTEVWQSDKKGKVGFGRDPIHEWLRWHSGKSIMARFLKSRACPPPAKILAQNGNTMTLQETINEVFAKLAAAGVYNTPAKTTKTGDLIIKKEELVADIEKWLNIVAPSLAKTNKLDLRELHRAVECKTGNTHTKAPTNT
jgi:hypothetical protein